MADIARLQQALKNAHAAGDTEAATKLAGALKQYRDQQPQQSEAPQEEENFLQKADQGVLGVAQGAIADPLIGIGQLAGRGVDAITGDAFDLSGKADKLSTAQEEWYRKKRKELGGTGADIARGAGTIASALIPAVGAAGKLGKASQVAAKTGEAIFAPVNAAAKALKQIPGIKDSKKAKRILDKFTGKNLEGGSLKQGLALGAQAPLTQRAVTEAEQDNYWERKIRDAALGAGIGGALSPLTRMSDIVKPNTDLGKYMKKLGVGTTGQRKGSTGFEDTYAKSVIGGGNVVRKAQDEAIDVTKRKLSQDYDDMWAKARVTDDAPFKEIATKVQKIVNNKKQANLSSQADDIALLDDFDKLLQGNLISKTVVKTPKQVSQSSILGSAPKQTPQTQTISRRPSGKQIDDIMLEMKALEKKAVDVKNFELAKKLKGYRDEVENAIAKQSDEGFKSLFDKNRKLWGQLINAEKKAKKRGESDAISTLGLMGAIGGTALHNPVSPLIGGLALQMPALFIKYPQLGNLLGESARHAIPLGLGAQNIKDTEVNLPQRKEGGLVSSNIRDLYTYDMLTPNKKKGGLTGL